MDQPTTRREYTSSTTAQLPRATLNVKDFSGFVEHEGLTIITD